MGCDIHAVMEVSVNDRWEFYREIEMGRSYELFGKMAGVRDSTVRPISDPKGLPKNMSGITQLYFWEENVGDYYHSYSYLDSSELGKLYRWLVTSHGMSWDKLEFDMTRSLRLDLRYAARAICLIGYNDGLKWADIWEHLDKGRAQDLRLVFAFDS